MTIPVWKVPWFRHLAVSNDEGVSYTSSIVDVLCFGIEPVNLLNWEYSDRRGIPDRRKFPYRYRCLSCLQASGREDCFVTQVEALERMKDTPTKEQQEQMSNHAQQHSIMYQWAKGVE